MAGGRVVAVARDGAHRFSKRRVAALTLLAGRGVEGDAHAGVTVRHRSRVAADPTQPNLRQVHLIHAELLRDLAAGGFDIAPADLGENVTTAGIDLLGLARGARLAIGGEVVLEVTGLRNPCAQIERFRPGLLAAVLDRGGRPADPQGRHHGGGAVRRGDPRGRPDRGHAARAAAPAARAGIGRRAGRVARFAGAAYLREGKEGAACHDQLRGPPESL